MIGNISLQQNIEFIELINLFLKEKAFSEEVMSKFGVLKHDPFEMHFIGMSEDLQDSLDYVSKLTREPDHIARLVKDGEKQGLAFLERRMILHARGR